MEAAKFGDLITPKADVGRLVQLRPMLLTAGQR
jgi:hypothetical protein